MSAPIELVQEWLKDMPDDCVIAVEEGGLTLVAVLPNGQVTSYYELGGLTTYNCKACDWYGLTCSFTPVGDECCPECGSPIEQRGVEK